MQTLKDTYHRSRWFMPAFALVLGAVFMVAQWIGGDATGGLVSLGIMAAFAALLVVLEGRSESSSWPSWCSPHAARIRARTPGSALWAASPTSSP
jgi:hypothetical protein